MIKQPHWANALYTLPEHIRYVTVRGGRGSGKSWGLGGLSTD